jgi:hypothetical protein
MVNKGVPMSPDLDAKLCADFPLLYSVRYADTRHTLSHVGFETGDGWFGIIYGLSAELERIIEKLPMEERNNYYAVQVKEKFGLLNFYMSKATEEMRSSIGEAEGKSASPCEECGQPGKLRGGRWLKILCDAHAADR